LASACDRFASPWIQQAEPKVADLAYPLITHKHILGVEVTVDHVLGMQVLHSTGNIERNLQLPCERALLPTLPCYKARRNKLEYFNSP
jgi:hypothetical protein